MGAPPGFTALCASRSDMQTGPGALAANKRIPLRPSASTASKMNRRGRGGARRALDSDDHARWFWYSVLGRFPEHPRIPHDPAAAERARQAQAAIEARNFTVTKGVDGNVILTLDDGTTAKLTAQ